MNDLSDAEFSVAIATQAGAMLLELRESYGQIGDRIGELRNEGDRRAHQLLADLIAEFRPDDALLSEEGKDDDARLAAQRVWIVDPLDGTFEYGQGRADWAVHVALWDARAQALSACTVDLPAQQVTRSVLDPQLDLARLPADRPIRIVASRNHPPRTLPAVADLLAAGLAADGLGSHGVEIVEVGSVGGKVNELLSGRAEAYVHDTGFHEWDVAAPYGVAQHCGLIATHLDGSEVTFNHMPPRVGDLLVSHPVLLPYLQRALAEAATT